MVIMGARPETLRMSQASEEDLILYVYGLGNREDRGTCFETQKVGSSIAVAEHSPVRRHRDSQVVTSADSGFESE
jgi:hypothetical protein